MGIEDPELDVAEQRLPLADLEEDEDDEGLPERAQPPLDVDPADFADQHRGVPSIDEDDPSAGY
ncbi:MAG: hypothetical protein JO063_00455 [Pseudonocardiales bacterium]|nr:hypothetical protein [Pseudonocardiales bacterium]MBV9032014.1 hypothetical protein [Pseudonocardiales bacterium]MBW0008582.1 hypothetical protein [Pseudonocardiales bacterium]